MRRRATLARPLCLRDEIIPLRQLSAEIALWQFQQQGGDGFGDLAQVVQRQQLLWRADEPCAQVMQVLVRLLLVHLQMAERVEGDGRATLALAPDTQGDLL